MKTRSRKPGCGPVPDSRARVDLSREIAYSDDVMANDTTDQCSELLAARADLAALDVFSSLREHPLLAAFEALLAAADSATAAAESALALCQAWALFAKTFVGYAQNNSFYETVAGLVLNDDNPFARAAEGLRAAARSGAGGEPALPPLLSALGAADLERLGRIAAFDIPKLGFHIAAMIRHRGLVEAAKNIEAETRAFWAGEGTAGGIAHNDCPADAVFPKGAGWAEALPRLAAYISRHGAGELARGHFFFWAGGADRGGLRPVRNPDPVRPADLAGYENQRSVISANTLRFIEGKPANNLLLHGDRGTGKSASIKAICNEYAEKGLRLLEVRKRDLFELPAILDVLAARSLPFIVFIDDLSFEAVDDSFTCLKALLEGGVEVRPPNVVIYATSNRRHLVKERRADRPSLAEAAADFNGEVRAFETMQEQFSLADRFGLSLVFTAPDQEEYLRIAGHIAHRRGLSTGGAFQANALRWEKWFNGRSPRTAVQFVDWLAGGAGFPWE